MLYAALLFFLGALVVRTMRYARQPVHLRWELHPIAHDKSRAMAAEILLLDGIRRHNRTLWRVSLPFHLGVYLIIAWIGMILLSGLIRSTGTPASAFSQTIGLLGFSGLALGLYGSAGLMLRRLTDPSLRAYNAPADLFNLGIWLVYLGWTLIVHVVEGGFDSLIVFAGDWLRLAAHNTSTPIAVELLLGAFLLAYLPLSRMFHFVAKYFLYHDVRWDEKSNARNGPMERRLAQAMTYDLPWDSPHTSHARTWNEAVDQTQNETKP
jgi:nitrate reductase gamma subunit